VAYNKEKELKSLKEGIYKDVKATVSILNKTRVSAIRNKVNEAIANKDNIMTKNTFAGFIVCFMVVTLLIFRLFSDTYIPYGLALIDSELHKYNGTSITLSMNEEDNSLNCMITTACIKTKRGSILSVGNFRWVRSDLSPEISNYKIGDKTYNITTKTSLNSFKFNSSLAYMQYSNVENTGNKEFIIMDANIDTVDTSDMTSQGVRLKLKNSLLQNRISANTYYSAFIMLSETLSGGRVKHNELTDELYTMEDSMKYSSKDNYTITLNFDGTGELKMSEFDGIINNPEITYIRNDGVIRVASTSDDTTYMLIGCINNDVMGCAAKDLLNVNNSKVYINKNEVSDEYTTLGFINENNLYLIQFNNKYREVLINNVLNQFDLDVNIDEIISLT